MFPTSPQFALAEINALFVRRRDGQSVKYLSAAIKLAPPLLHLLQQQLIAPAIFVAIFSRAVARSQRRLYENITAVPSARRYALAANIAPLYVPRNIKRQQRVLTGNNMPLYSNSMPAYLVVCRWRIWRIVKNGEGRRERGVGAVCWYAQSRICDVARGGGPLSPVDARRRMKYMYRVTYLAAPRLSIYSSRRGALSSLALSVPYRAVCV